MAQDDILGDLGEDLLSSVNLESVQQEVPEDYKGIRCHPEKLSVDAAKVGQDSTFVVLHSVVHLELSTTLCQLYAFKDYLLSYSSLIQLRLESY